MDFDNNLLQDKDKDKAKGNIVIVCLVCLFVCLFSLPDSAAEPDPEMEKIERGEPKVIPHDEVRPNSEHIHIK